MMASEALALDSVLVREEEVVAQKVKDEVVMLSLKTDRFYALNAVGTEIWALLEDPMSVADLCLALQRSFDVKLSTCLKDVTALIEDMRREALVRVVGP
jgi:hypothetical protein